MYVSYLNNKIKIEIQKINKNNVIKTTKLKLLIINLKLKCKEMYNNELMFERKSLDNYLFNRDCFLKL